MEKNVPILTEKINDDLSLQIQCKKKYSLPVSQREKENIFQKKGQENANIEDQIKLSHSNYKSFLWKHKRNPKYPLPSSFNIINIADRSEQSSVDGYEWFNFPILSYSCRQLSSLAVKIITGNGFNNICNTEQVTQLVNRICRGYNTVSYHNFSHGFSLMHMLYHLVKLDTNFKSLFTFEEIGYSLIAALAHDLGHFGTNNALEVKMQTQLAKQSNKQAVLQKMHIKILFNSLKQSNIQIFQRSTDPNKMKKLIIMNILATDFSQHFKNLQKFKNLLKQNGNLSNHKQLLNISKNNSELDELRYFYMTQVFHACDIGNPCLEHQEYMNWAALLSYQFNTQTIIQSQNNCQVSEMLRYKSQKQFYKGQIGFINNFVYPIWELMSINWPGFQFLVDNIRSNIKILELKQKNHSNKQLKNQKNDTQI